MPKVYESNLKKINEIWNNFFVNEINHGENRLDYLMNFSDELIEWIENLTITKVEYYDNEAKLVNLFTSCKTQNMHKHTLVELIYEPAKNHYTFFEPIGYTKKQLEILEKAINELNFMPYLISKVHDHEETTLMKQFKGIV